MKSMTGYAYRELCEASSSLSVEIKGYNSRFLEIAVNIPPLLSGLEPKIRERIAETAGRGKVEVSIRMKDASSFAVSVNTEAAKAYMDAVSILADTLHLAERPSLSLLLGIEGIIELDRKRDDERCWKALEPVLTAALKDFDAERSREGARTETDILSYAASLEASLGRVQSFSLTIESTIKNNIRTRFAELLGTTAPDMENRLLAETALLLMKYTIAEEIFRLNAHLAEFRAETKRNPRPGKKLDFLCQEINREINTIGSKTALLEVSREVVAMKDALENIREQLRNVA